MSPIFFFCKEILMKQSIEGIHNFCSSIWLFRLAAPSSKLSKRGLILWAVCIHAVFYRRLIKSHFASPQIVWDLSPVQMIKTPRDAANQTQQSRRNLLLLSAPCLLANSPSMAKMKSTSHCTSWISKVVQRRGDAGCLLSQRWNSQSLGLSLVVTKPCNVIWRNKSSAVQPFLSCWGSFDLAA